MRDETVSDVRRRAPAVLVLLAFLALLVSVCHGHAHGYEHAHGHGHGHAHEHLLPSAGTTTASTPGLPHGCGHPGEPWSFDVHLPAPAPSPAPQLAPPDAAGAVPLSYDEVFAADPHACRVRGRAGPGPEPGSLLLALGVDRN